MADASSWVNGNTTQMKNSESLFVVTASVSLESFSKYVCLRPKTLKQMLRVKKLVTIAKKMERVLHKV